MAGKKQKIREFLQTVEGGNRNSITLLPEKLRLTKLGENLIPIINAMFAWGKNVGRTVATQ